MPKNCSGGKKSKLSPDYNSPKPDSTPSSLQRLMMRGKGDERGAGTAYLCLLSFVPKMHFYFHHCFYILYGKEKKKKKILNYRKMCSEAYTFLFITL